MDSLTADSSSALVFGGHNPSTSINASNVSATLGGVANVGNVVNSNNNNTVNNHNTTNVHYSTSLSGIGKTPLEWLSPIDLQEHKGPLYQQTVYSTKRTPGTGQRLLDFVKDWLPSSSHLLWVYGGVGCGKSYLCSNLVDNLLPLTSMLSDSPTTLSTVAYFYISFQETVTHQRATFVKSIIAQLYRKTNDLPAFLHLHKSKNDWPAEYEDLYNVLYKTLQCLPSSPGPTEAYDPDSRPLGQVTLVVDGIDEIPVGETRKEFLNLMDRLAELTSSHFRIIIFSRDIPDLRDCFVPQHGWTHLAISSQSDLADDETLTFRHNEFDYIISYKYIEADIRTFVINEIESDRYMSGYSREDKEKIIKHLSQNVDGMFRLAALQMQELSSMGLRKVPTPMLDRILRELPSDLRSFYKRMIDNIDKRLYHELWTALKWMALATRPLYIEEVVDACATEPHAKESFSASRRFHPLDIVNKLNGLVSLEPAYSPEKGPLPPRKHVMKLAHSSVKEYLLVQWHQTPQGLTLAHDYIALSCLAYLGHCASQVKGQSSEYPLRLYAWSSWAFHLTAASSDNARDPNKLSEATASYTNVLLVKFFQCWGFYMVLLHRWYVLLFHGYLKPTVLHQASRSGIPTPIMPSTDALSFVTEETMSDIERERTEATQIHQRGLQLKNCISFPVLYLEENGQPSRSTHMEQLHQQFKAFARRLPTCDIDQLLVALRDTNYVPIRPDCMNDISAEMAYLITFQHQALPDAPRVVRFVVLHPALDEQERICCSICVDSLDNSPQYEALSYYWGKDFGTKYGIKVNGSHFDIYHNLFSALTRLRYKDKPRVLWIDALSVSMADLTERTSQVSQMADIYSSSRRVLAWASDLQQNDYVSLRATTQEDEREKFSRILSSNLWRRAWAIQELVAATKVIIISDEETRAWDNVMTVPSIASSSRSLWLPPKQEESLKAMLNIHRLRDIYKTRELHLPELLYLSKYHQTSVHVDKVFCLMSLLKGEQRALRLLEGAYTVSTEEVFAKTAAYVMTRYQNLDILSCCQPSNRYYHPTPSWVPTWFWSCDSGDFDRRFPLAPGIFDPSQPNLYNAGGSKPHKPHVLSRDYKTVTVSGAKIDSITVSIAETVEIMEVRPRDQEDWPQCLYDSAHGESLRQSYPTDALLQNALDKAETMERVDIFSDFEGKEGAGVSERSFIQEIQPIFRRQNAEDHAGGSPIFNRYSIRESGARMFIGRAGRICSVDWCFKPLPGDIIVVLLGGTVPYIIRPQEAGTYEFVCECYVHGIMDGEILEALKRGEVTLQDFTLI